MHQPEIRHLHPRLHRPLHALAGLLLIGALGLSSAGAGAATRPAVGSPVPSTAPPGEPGPINSQPPDLHNYSRPASPGLSGSKRALPSGYTIKDVVVSNTNPNLRNTDTNTDWEPSLAVNGNNTNQLDIYTFSSTWGGGNAAVWHSSNGGSTWTKAFTVRKPTGRSVTSFCPCDVTLDYDRSSHLFGTFLDAQEGVTPGDIYTGDTSNPLSAAAWQWFTVGGVAQKTDTLTGGADDTDQPWLRINRAPGNANQDNAYVGYDDFTSPETIQVAAALGSRPPNFVRNTSPGVPGCCVNPGTRLTVDHRNGKVYVLWQYATGTNPDGSKAILYALNRSTNAGSTWTLNGSSTGVVVAPRNSDQPRPKFGTVNALLGGVDHAAVDPNNGDVYYVYGTKDANTGTNRLAIKRLTPNGSGGLSIPSSGIFVSGQHQAALPAVAVASNGTVGVLYDTFEGFNANGFPVFAAHLARSHDHGQTFSDATLLKFASPTKDNGNPGQRILGDYQQLRVVRNTFFGVFSGNGAAFGRSTSNIDPIFFKGPAG
jgi:hypothetical protein